MSTHDKTKVSDQLEALQRATSERNEAVQTLTETERQLALARSRPIGTLLDLMVFHTLNFLAARTKIVPEQMASRFKKSAAKRAPYRKVRGPLRDNVSDVAFVPSVKSALLSGRIVPNPSWPTVLVVSHVAARTGAPIVALNLAQALAHRYNVVSLVLKSGDILEHFRNTSTEVHVADKFHHAGSGYSAMIRKLCRDHKFTFAIVNSIESRGVLKPLRAQNVPAVTLVHEFSSYTRPTSVMTDVSKLSELVFSTQITLDNALIENPNLNLRQFQVLPQGKCEVPNVVQSAAQKEAEQNWLKSSLGLNSDGSPPFLIVGAGQVQLRKGVDLFIEVATRVLSDKGSKDVRFAWIGDGYDPKRDLDYSVYLYDQLQRAGISDRVQILRATSEIEYVYKIADVFVLSSRLDPLPNVAIDALSAGVPVVCFDRASGIAECLKAGGLGHECVAEYTDTSDMAEKLLRILAADSLRHDLSLRSRQVSEKLFDFSVYSRKIELIGLDAAHRNSA